jgi:hypothetical protein
MPKNEKSFAGNIFPLTFEKKSSLSDEGVCARSAYDPDFKHFSEEELFRNQFPHRHAV